MTRAIATVCVLTAAFAAAGQDVVRYRERGKALPTEDKGKIEAESLAGVKIKGKTVPAGDILDVTYEPPSAVRLDVLKAIGAENRRAYDEAVKEYRSVAANPAAAAVKPYKRHLEYKAALLTALKADESPEQLKAATDAMTKFVADHPDGWQRVAATRWLARLALDREPPDAAAAAKAFDDLAKLKIAPPELKRECAIRAIDAWLAVGNTAEAKNRLAQLPANDPRTAAYQIACNARPDAVEAAAKQLTDLIDKADPAVKGLIYNLLGQVYSLDPKRKKDALFAHLWVDVVYNQDPQEVAKAQDRIADLFKALNQDERAKTYRDKSRGR